MGSLSRKKKRVVLRPLELTRWLRLSPRGCWAASVLTISDPPSAKSIMEQCVVAEESAWLGSTHVRKIIHVNWEDRERSIEVRRGYFGQEFQSIGFSGPWMGPAQRPRVLPTLILGASGDGVYVELIDIVSGRLTLCKVDVLCQVLTWRGDLEIPEKLTWSR
ncbi:hypothetical protein GW17_00058991 [Ensete ventricosum]|nr:hypothetical protein GW17_00058991 [Ensete ventricosum]RZS08361.1 hypothetical protein BHM03_00039323 [Ensete ventricosum]